MEYETKYKLKNIVLIQDGNTITLNRREILEDIDISLALRGEKPKDFGYEYMKAIKDYTLYCHNMGDTLMNPNTYIHNKLRESTVLTPDELELMTTSRMDELINKKREEGVKGSYLDYIHEMFLYVCRCWIVYDASKNDICLTCDQKLTKKYFKRHIRTKKHLSNLQRKEYEE